MQPAPDHELTIRELRREDLSRVADVHLAAFGGSALSALGKEAVRRNYLWLLEGPHERTALGVFAGSELIAFCFGGRFNGALTGFLHANRAYLAVRVLTHPWLAFGPLFRDRIKLALKLLVVRARGTRTPPPPSTRPAFGILAIAVDPHHQRSGAGRLLMARNEELARAAGFERMELCVASSNDKAIQFYERIGWHKSLEDGRWAKEGVMMKRLSA